MSASATKSKIRYLVFEGDFAMIHEPHSLYSLVVESYDIIDA